MVADPNGTENGFPATEVNSPAFAKVDFANKANVTVDVSGTTTVQATPKGTSTTIDVFGSPTAGSPTVNLGQIDPITGNGTLQNIQGPVTILSTLPPGTPSNPNLLPGVVLNDFGDTAVHNVFILATEIINLAPAPIILSAASVSVLEIGGSISPTTGSTYTIEGTPAADSMQVAAPGPKDTITVLDTPAGPTTAIASPTVVVGQGSLQGIQGTVEIINAYLAQFSGAGNNFHPADVKVDDSTDTQPQTVVIGPGGVSRQSVPAAPINQITGPTGISSIGALNYLSGVSSTGHNTYTITGTPATTLLKLSVPGPDTVNVHGTTAGPTTAILAGSGGHTFNVGSTTDSTSTLDAVQGLLTITSTNNTDSADTLHIFDRGSSTPHIYTITPGSPDASTTTFKRSAPNPVTIQFSSIITLAPPQENPAGPGTMAAQLAFPSAIEAGSFATMTGRLVGTGELSLSVDWGDGTPVAHSTPDREPFSVKHKYARPGTYHVRAVWTDSTGQSGFRELTITVSPRGKHDEGNEDRDAIFAALDEHLFHGKDREALAVG
jgi:hypothetical protein